MNVQSTLVIRNFLVILKWFLNAKCSLSLWRKTAIGHGKWFLHTNLFLIKMFLITKLDCILLVEILCSIYSIKWSEWFPQILWHSHIFGSNFWSKFNRIKMYLEEQLCSFWLSSIELWIDIDSKSSEIVDKSSSSVKEKKNALVKTSLVETMLVETLLKFI